MFSSCRYRSEVKPESARDNIFNPYNSCGIDNSNHQPSNKSVCNEITSSASNNNSLNNLRTHSSTERSNCCELVFNGDENNLNCNNSNKLHSSTNADIENSSLIVDVNSRNISINSTAITSLATANHTTANNASSTTCTHSTHFNGTTNTATAHSSSSCTSAGHSTHTRKRQLCSSNLDNDLEILDRELSAINAPMPLIDPEITQGAEQLEKAISSRKRLRSEDESDRLVREALSQFYIPQQRLISAIEDCPLDVVSVGSGMGVGVGLGLGMGVGVGMGMGPISPSKRQKLGNGANELELEFDLNQNQKDFEVIMDALRLGTPSPTPSVGSDSCGQAAMMSESASVFHNLVVTSLET